MSIVRRLLHDARSAVTIARGVVSADAGRADA
jgi:hypothetical protein